MGKQWFIVVEEENIVGNPIKVTGNMNDLGIEDSNGNELNTHGIFKSLKLAKQIAITNKNRTIYTWKEGSKEAWYRGKK